MTEVNRIDDCLDGEEEDQERYVPSLEASCEPMGGKKINFFAMKLVGRGGGGRSVTGGRKKREKAPPDVGPARPLS